MAQTTFQDCPFCGSSSKLRYDLHFRRVICDNCDALGPFHVNSVDSVRLWNERAGKIEPEKDIPACNANSPKCHTFGAYCSLCRRNTRNLSDQDCYTSRE